MDIEQLCELLEISSNEIDYASIMADVPGSQAVRFSRLVNDQIADSFENRPGPGPILDSLMRLRYEMDFVLVIGDELGQAYEIDQEYAELAAIYT